jgi:SAC3/GANP family
MSITAAGADSAPRGSELRKSAIAVYEAAADASCLAGNLGFYCTCLSRLLKDFYPVEAATGATPARRAEMFGASLLYYSVFARAQLEVACHQREMTADLRKAPAVRFALAAASCVARGQYCVFFRLFADEGTSRQQRTVMASALAEMRTKAFRTIARAYMTVEVSACADWLGYKSDQADELRKLLVETLPMLDAVNSDASSPIFNLRRR